MGLSDRLSLVTRIDTALLGSMLQFFTAALTLVTFAKLGRTSLGLSLERSCRVGRAVPRDCQLHQLHLLCLLVDNDWIWLLGGHGYVRRDGWVAIGVLSSQQELTSNYQAVGFPKPHVLPKILN